MAKLGERVSTGAWISALGNGLRPEFKESKDGILYYTKDGYNSVMAVKTKLLSEEAVLLNKSKKDKLNTKESDDAIALVSAPKTKDVKPTLPLKNPNPPKDITLFTKGKGGKGKGKWNSKGNRWRAPASDWEIVNNWSDWSNQNQGKWTPTSKGGKGKGKDDKRFDSQSLWCDIHQKYGHSTDWCFDNPNRTGGPPPNIRRLVVRHLQSIKSCLYLLLCNFHSH
jgi:hypothetical protein